MTGENVKNRIEQTGANGNNPVIFEGDFYLGSKVGGNKLNKVGSQLNSITLPYDVAMAHSELSAGQSKILVPSSGAQQFKIREIKISIGGTNFSGGGGDRNLQVWDGTNVYTIIPAATLQSLANARWGSTPVPYPASIGFYIPTAAGANIVAKYQGGTTDYTAGSILISVDVIQVA